MDDKSQGTNDRFISRVMLDVRKAMDIKIKNLQKEQASLTISLAKKFDCDEYRRLSIVNQHLQVAYSRRKGDWVKGDHPEYANIRRQG